VPYKVWNKDHYQCSDCRQLVEKDAGECPKCGRFTAPSGSSGQSSSGSSWVVGCLGCLGLSFLLVLVCMICPKSDTASDSSATSGSTSGGQYILNETGILDPGAKQRYIVSLQEGKYIGERFGLPILEVYLVKQSTEDELTRTTLRDDGNLGRWQWYVSRAGAYYVVVYNASMTTRTDYILKFLKGTSR
jgi:hypothetical protein